MAAYAKIIRAADLFCGAGGTSTGLLKAIEELGCEADVLAINHWDLAIATHSCNHEDVRHLCQNLDKVDPLELVPSGRLNLLVASPECTHHSNARGGKPRSDQKRADAWLLMRWLDKLYVENLLIENVKEFKDWGPLGANGLPMKRSKGQFFRRFIETLEVTYRVEWRILCAADYGDPTTRERFFLIARRPKHKTIVWPARTHASREELAQIALQPQMFSTGTNLKPWVPARDIIDWSIPGTSIFGRKKPLQPNTLKRIFAGLRKYSGLALVMATGGRQTSADPRSIDQPLPTVMPNSRLNVVRPFLMNISHTGANGDLTCSIDEPVRTITSQQEHALVESLLINMKGASVGRSLDEPTFTQTTRPHQFKADAVLINMKGDHDISRSVEDPTFTQTAGGNHQGIAAGELQPYIVPTNHGAPGSQRAHSIAEPMPTVTGVDAWALIEPYLIQYFNERSGQEPRTRSIEDPLWTVTAQERTGVVLPFLMSAPSPNIDPESVEEPLRTVLSRDHQGVVEGEAFLVKSYEGSDACSIDNPVPSITANWEHLGLARPYLIKYYGTSDGQALDDPLGTVTAKDRFGLVIPELGAILDIRFRMLQPHELAAAQGFPRSYSFSGKRKDKVKQIGNAVPVQTARALCYAILTADQEQRIAA